MKAFYIDEPNHSSIHEIEVPVPKRDEVLIEVKAVGICGTDAHLYLGDYANPYPTIPGHEFSGIVAAVGENVKNFKLGQRVACDPNIYCESCDNCKQNKQNYCLDYKGLGNHVPGAFQQYMVINERCVYDIGNLSFTEASFIEPLACVLHGHDIVRPHFGEKVLILGAGPIGLMHLQVCKMMEHCLLQLQISKRNNWNWLKNMERIIPSIMMKMLEKNSGKSLLKVLI